MFEIRRMPEAGREENHVRHLAARRQQCLQRAALQIEERAEPGDAQGFELVGKEVRGDVAVFQHLAQPARRAGVVAEHRPLTVSQADEVAAGGDDEAAADRLHAPSVVKKGRAGIHQIRRDQTFAQQLLRAVKIRQNRVDQARPLRQPGRNLRPLGGGNQQRNGIELVRLTHAANVAVNIKGGSQIRDHAGGGGGDRTALLGAPTLDLLAHAEPMRPDLTARIPHFIPHRTAHPEDRRRCGLGAEAVGHGSDDRPRTTCTGSTGSSASPA